jgi:hypothetical protein
MAEIWQELGDDHAVSNQSFMQRYLAEPLTFIHTLLTVVVAWWALTLDMREEMSPTLLRIMPSSTWHVVLSFGAIAGFLGVAIEKYRRASTQILSFLHGLIAVAIIVHDPFAPWAAPYASLAIFAGYLCLKARSRR